jgi:hypothetical protein
MANLQSSVMSIVPNSGKSFNAVQSHAFVPADANKLLLEMFGRPDGPYMLSNESLQRNLQPDDILGQYIGRELKLFSQAVTAAVANDRSAIMLLIFPVVETLETQFSIQYLEPNMVPWSRVTNFGIPRETTYSQWSESYTTQRKKQMARIEKNFLLDPNYGRQYWDMMTRNLGGNAKMTMIIDACLQSVEQPFRNMFQDQNKRNAFDHNRLFNAEVADFGIAGRNPDLFYKALIKQKPGQFPIPFDTILAPEGVFQQLKENASDGGPIPCERAELSAETNRIHSIIFNGPSSTKTFNVGGRTIQCIEVPPQYCNMQDTTVKVFRPFETTLTYADIVPLDIGSSLQQYSEPVSQRFDRFAYSQTQTYGHQERFEFRRALDNIWLYNAVTGEPSPQYTSFITKLNTDMAQHGVNVPPEWSNTTDINEEPVAGVDRYTPDMIKDARGDLRQMHNFRDQFPFATFDPLQRRWRMPIHMGDMHQRQLTNERVRQAAQLIVGTMTREETSTAAFNDIADLVSMIRRQNWSESYVNALIKANQDYLVEEGSILPDIGSRTSFDAVPQWTPNEYGSLRLPSGDEFDGEAIGTYPAGYGSWSGLQTLAQEADKMDSIWRTAGEHARRVTNHIERLHTVLGQYVPESALTDGRSTATWFHVDDGGRSVLLDTIVQLKTGEKRPGPISLARKVSEINEREQQDVVKRYQAISGTIDELPTKEDIESGQIVLLDKWLALGAVVPVEQMTIIQHIAKLLEGIRTGTVTIRQNGVASTSPGVRIVADIEDKIVATIGRLSPLTNSRLLPDVEALIASEEAKKAEPIMRASDSPKEASPVQAISDSEYNGNVLMVIFNAITRAVQVVPKGSEKRSKLEPYFDLAKRTQKLEEKRTSLLNKTSNPNNRNTLDEDSFLRAPLEATGNVHGLYTPDKKIGAGLIKNWSASKGETDASSADTDSDAAVIDADIGTNPVGRRASKTVGFTSGAEKVVGQRESGVNNTRTKSRFDIFTFPMSLNVTSGASSLYSDKSSSYGAYPGASSSTSSLADMFSGVMYGVGANEGSGQTNVSRVANRGGYFPGAMNQASTDEVQKLASGGIQIGGNDGSFFGPWSARLKWIHANISNGIERLVALSILTSRNVLQTHRALIDVGAALIRIDGWRTGITIKTAALVRLVRGASTAFTVLARITVIPTLEGVTGDLAVTGEMFHGIVFQNRKQIDLLMNAVLLQYMGGKGSDAVEMPEHLDLPADQAPSTLYFADSENAGKVEYPRHLLNENYFYQDNTATPSPYRKQQYAAFAAHVLGKRVEGFSDSHLDKSIYSGKIRRCLVGNLAANYGYNEGTRQFSNRVAGSSVVGSIELNTADAWRGYNGGIFPMLAEDRPTPN